MALTLVSLTSALNPAFFSYLKSYNFFSVGHGCLRELIMDVLHIPHPCEKKKIYIYIYIGEEGSVVITLRLRILCPKGILP